MGGWWRGKGGGKGAPPPPPVLPDEANTCFGTCDYTVDMCAEKESVGPVAKFLTGRGNFFFQGPYIVLKVIPQSVFILGPL